jgi:hypothetical protein
MILGLPLLKQPLFYLSLITLGGIVFELGMFILLESKLVRMAGVITDAPLLGRI